MAKKDNKQYALYDEHDAEFIGSIFSSLCELEEWMNDELDLNEDCDDRYTVYPLYPGMFVEVDRTVKVVHKGEK